MVTTNRLALLLACAALGFSGAARAGEAAKPPVAKKAPKAALSAEDAQWALARKAFAKKDHKQALAEYSRFYQDYGTSPRAPEALYQVALCYEALGDHRTAILSLKVLSKKFKESPFAAKATALRTKLEAKLPAE